MFFLSELTVWCPEQKFLLFRDVCIFDVLLINCALKLRRFDVWIAVSKGPDRSSDVNMSPQ